jgi:EAL domain-containing protein (putative c-di-GMP-specific phosphodiesterase class I)
VTVEGVETPGQVDFLYDAHADQVQGFYFGRPVPAKAVSEEVLAHILNGGPGQTSAELTRPD